MQARPIENTSPKIRSIRTLKQWIQQGQLPSGEPLPPEHELARLLNVSRTTVRSAVKSIEEEGLVRSSDNRRRIVVGPARQAGGLVSDTVVVLTNMDVKPRDPLSLQTGWEKFIQIGLLDAIRDAGMHALTLQLDLLDKELIRNLTAGRPRGLVLMRPALHPPASLELATALRDQGVPVVCYGYAPSENFDTVASDSAAGSYELTKWLIGTGRRRLLRVWPFAKSGEVMPEWQRQRGIGFERAVAENGLELLPMAEFPSLPPAQIENRERFDMQVRLMVGYLYEQLKGPDAVDALVAISDGQCYSIAAACRILGREPNRDIAITGYDNYWKDCIERHWEPTGPLATVDKLNLKLGHEVVALLQERLQGKLPPEPQTRLVKPELQIVGGL